MRAILTLLFWVLFTPLFAQQTVGLFWNDSLAYNGYTLFSPSASNVTYLIDNCGNKVHSWQSAYEPGLTGYLLPDGTLLRAGRNNTNINFNAGGAAGIVERLAWDGTVLWHYEYSTNDFISNHDIQALPNGNVLLMAYNNIGENAAINLGRKPATVDSIFWEATIVEIEPIGTDSGRIVWQWRASEHVVQDFDSTKPNYAPIASRPNRININYPDNLDADWQHMNGIDYNAELDQILVSVHRFNELWIIDHSTTTAEAASSLGGNSGKGGDLLYRWGNPAAYRRGNLTNQVFYQQHDAQWIPQGYPNAGKITVYNNGQGRPEGNYSTVDIIEPPIDGTGNYVIMPGQPFGPDTLFYSYVANPPLSFYSRNISGAQALPNGNLLVCEGAEGRLFEIGPNDSIVWQYIVPVNSLGPIAQGSPSTSNNTFQSIRYSIDYPAFIGKSLTPQGPIEQNPLPSNCRLFLPDTTTGFLSTHALLVQVYPNPTLSQSTITIPYLGAAHITLLDARGSVMHSTPFTETIMLNLSYLATGLYSYHITTTDGRYAWGKLVKE